MFANGVNMKLTLKCIFLLLIGNTFVAGWLFDGNQEEVCFGSLGCFSVRPPFTNIPTYLPHPPETIGTKFLLFTRSNKEAPQELEINSTSVLICSWSSFDSHQLTKIIIHGYQDHAKRDWVKAMVKALLVKDSYNVVVVDWRKGADEYSYPQSAANIRVVGTQVAQLLLILEQTYNLNLEMIHIIGHSLGAHVAGYAGEFVSGIGRITGLDPAGPLFDKTDPAVRLDPTDALFVDVIHTDAENLYELGFGTMDPVGTADFYPNGGMNQPGCPASYLDQMKLLMMFNFEFINNFGCSHLRSYRYFTESINSDCSFLAYRCGNVTARDYHGCNTCDQGCARMGFHANSSTARGLYYLQTKSNSPFCSHIMAGTSRWWNGQEPSDLR